MSAKPYVVQQDSPNLVIVPTETYSEQPPKEVKSVNLNSDVSMQNLPTPTQNVYSALTNKASKHNFSARTINNDVLIDVAKLKKPPTSWASNFLQSIGGPSVKFSRGYYSPPKLALIHTERTEQESNKEINVLNTHQSNTNTATIQPIMEKEKSLPKINMNLIKHKVNKPSIQSAKPTLTKEISLPNNIKVNQTKTCTSPGIRNEPALPKGYRIPIQSKCNKATIQSTEDTNTNLSSSDNLTHQLKNNTAKTLSVNALPRSQNDYVQLKYNKPVSQDAITNNETNQSEKKNDKYHGKINKPSSQERVQARDNSNNNEVNNVNDKNLLKPNEMLPQSTNKKYTSISKYNEHIIQSKRSKNAVQPKKYEEIKHLKPDKEMKRNNSKQTDLRRSKYASPTRYNKEITIHKSNKENDQLKYIKEASNKKEITYSTKLKTKKCHEMSNIIKRSKSEYSPERQSKKHKDKTKKESNTAETCSETVQIKKVKLSKAILKKEELILKLQRKKKAIEKKIREAGIENGINNKIIRTETKQTKKDNMSKSSVEERSSKSVSPIKSVVKKIKSDHKTHNSDKNYKIKSDNCSHFEKSLGQDFGYNSDKCDSENKSHKHSDRDLRNKLKRKMNENNYNDEDSKWENSNKKNKFATIPTGSKFVPDENLIISFNAEDANEETDTQKKSPVKKLARKRPQGGKKCKKIKLEINIVFGNTDTTDEELMESEDEANNETEIENTDLSFLDDFNVDEIAESLNECNEVPKKTNEEIKNALSSDGKEMEIMAETERYFLLRNNDNEKAKTIPSYDISTDVIKMDSREEMEDQMTFNENRSIHNISGTNLCAENVPEAADIRSLAPIENIIVKKEDVNKNLNTNENYELHQTEDFKLQIETSKIPEANTSFASVHEIKRESDTNQCIIIESTLSENEKSMIQSRTALNETPIGKDSFENVTDLAQKKDIPMYICQDNVMNDHAVVNKSNKLDMLQNNTELVKKNPIHSDLKITKTKYSQEAETINTNPIANTDRTKAETIIIEPHVITIDDSEGENETETKNNKAKDDLSLKCDQEISKNKMSAELISENSESILVLDTDYNIDEESNDNTTNQSNVIDQNFDVENIIMPEGPKNIIKHIETTYDENKQDITIQKNCTGNKAQTTAETNVLSEKLPTDNKTNTSNNVNSGCKNTSLKDQTETNREIKITEKQDCKNEKGLLSNATRVDDSITSKEAPKTKLVKKTIVEPENYSPKSDTTNKAQNKENETKSENRNKIFKNIDAKMRAEVSLDLVNDKFVQKLEAKLFLFMGQKYLITELIHVGKFSKIYTCKDRLLCDFTIKVIKNEDDHIPLGRQKQNMLIKLQNGVPEHNLNCVRLIRGLSVCGLWCFVMEYYPRNLAEALEEYDRGFHIDEVQNLSRQLVSAVTILRNNNIIHSDIKPTHILINATNTRLKLCGFDQASYFDNTSMLPNTGTVNYRAPELILGYPASYGIDVWSTALVMFEMATNRKLFPGVFNNDILFKQLCTLGYVPMEMLMESTFRNTHFRGTAFTRILGAGGQRVMINEIKGNTRLSGMLFQAYSKTWAKRRNLVEKTQDEMKLSDLLELLRSMLVMYPKYRIAIEFVFANPFIYETCDR